MSRITLWSFGLWLGLFELAASAAAAESRDARLVQLLKSRQYLQADAWIAGMDLAERRLLTDDVGDDLDQRLELSPEGLALLDGWVLHTPGSAMAWYTRGMFLYDYGWAARGEGWASEVTDHGARLFRERLLQAEKDLEQAHALDPGLPDVPASLMGVAKALGRDRQYLDRQFNRALAADPHHFRAHLAKMTYLRERWHGAPGEALAFAREAHERLPVGSKARTVLARAHDDSYSSKQFREYASRTEVWAEIRGPMEEYLAAHPEDFETRNRYANIAYRAGKIEVARRELQIIGDRWDVDVWNTRKYFDEVKAWVMQWE